MKDTLINLSAAEKLCKAASIAGPQSKVQDWHVLQIQRKLEFYF
jgi:hypothetical protein